jgi:hypothetical protein
MSGRRPVEYRDETLGAYLRALQAPEHQPGFEAELRRRLTVARRASTALPSRRRRRWGVRLAAVAALVGVAVAVVVVGIPRTEHSPQIAGPQAASAAAIKARVRSALAAMQTLTGVLVSDGPGRGDQRRWRFALTAKGNFALAGPRPGERITYDAAAGVARSAQRSESLGGGPLFYAERRGVAPGPPDPGPPTWLLPTQFAAFVHALLVADDPRVRETTYDGRPAWVLAVDAVPSRIVPEFSGDRFELTVDRETGIPVRVLETKQGAFLHELRIRNLAVNSDLPRGVFELDFPHGAEVSRMNDGFEPVSLDEVASIVGYAPLVPQWVPQGYKLAEIAVAREAGPTGTEAGNPRSRMVVSLSYRRGIDQFLVTTRSAAGGPWSDPLATGEGFVDESERVTIGDGALQGQPANIVLVPRGIPHLWTTAGRLIVTVGGALGRTELLRIAGSLEPR